LQQFAALLRDEPDIAAISAKFRALGLGGTTSTVVCEKSLQSNEFRSPASRISSTSNGKKSFSILDEIIAE
jgi:hypothetical protein